MSDDDDQPKKKVVQEVQERRIFLYNMNSFIPFNLIDKLRKNEKNIFSGTVSNSNNLPKNFKPKIIKIDPQNSYSNNELFSNNYFICSLDDSKYSDIEYIIKGLKSKQHEEDKYLILISNIMTWSRTKQKVKIEKEEEMEADNEGEEKEDEDKKEMEGEEEDLLVQDEQEEGDMEMEGMEMNMDDVMDDGEKKVLFLFSHRHQNFISLIKIIN